MAEHRVFVTHAHEDRELAEAFAALISHATTVPLEHVFCSSVAGFGIPAGQDNFVQYLLRTLDGAPIVIALVSPAYAASPWCMFEYGCARAGKCLLIPILVEPIQPEDLPLFIGQMQGLSANRASVRNLGRDLVRELTRNGVAPSPERKKSAGHEADFQRRLKKLLPRAAHYDELKTLETELKSDIVGGGSVWELLQVVARSADAEEVRSLMMQMEEHAADVADVVFWRLLVRGVFRFNNIDEWSDSRKKTNWKWRLSLKYVEISPRGRALLAKIRRKG